MKILSFNRKERRGRRERAPDITKEEHENKPDDL
jgi:hypothetical protein